MFDSDEKTLSFFSSLLSGTEDTDGKFVYVSFKEDGQPTVKSTNSEIPTMLETLNTWNQEQGRNVYWSAGLRRPDLPEGSRGGEDDITKMLAIVVDLDDEDAAKNSGRLAAERNILPTYVIRTSTTPTERRQLVYVLNEPTDDLDAWRTAARKLEYYFGGDFCSKDAAHVWRVPGSTNWPNEKKRQAGRVPEISELVYSSGRTYELDDFEDLPEPPKETALVEVKPLNMTGASQKWTCMEEIISYLPEWLTGRMLSGFGIKDRSEFDFQLAKEVIKCGELNSTDYLLMYYMAAGEPFTEKWSEKEAAKTGAGDDYLARTWARALADAEIDSKVQTAAEEALPAVEEKDDDPWEKGTWRIEEIKELELPPQNYLAEPFLLEGAIHLVHAPTGQGKSHFVQHVVYALACGENPPPFSVNKAKRVLYVDGEMGARTIKKRLESLSRAYGDAGDKFLYLSPYMTKDGEVFEIDLRREKDRVHLARMCVKHKIDVVVLDNVRTLCPGLTENDAEAWADWNNLLVKLRSGLGLTVIWVHHDKKGHAKSEDDYGGEDYSGSTNALTTTEVQVQIRKCSKEKMERISEWVEMYYRDNDGFPTKYLASAVEMRYGKLRDGDMRIHKDRTLMFLKDADGPECTRLFAYEDEETDIGLAQLSLPEQCWIHKYGSATVVGGKSYGEIAKILGVAKTSVFRYIKNVEKTITEKGPGEEIRIRKLVDDLVQI